MDMDVSIFTELVKDKNKKYEVLDIIMPIIVSSLGTAEKDVLNRHLDTIKVLIEMGENAVYEQMKSILTHYAEEDKLSFDC